MIKSVHYLRGLAALIVVLFHFRYYLNDHYEQHPQLGDALFANGAFGVDLFFIISGFIICYATERNESKPLMSYVLKRVLRIYPLLVICLIAFYFLFDTGQTSLARSLIPLHADYTQPGPFFGYNMLSPVWTLTYEIFFYGLFFIGLSLSQHYRKGLTLLLLVSVFLGAQWYVNQGLTFSAHTQFEYGGHPVTQALLALSSSPMLLEFAYGIGLYQVFKLLPASSHLATRWLAPLSILLFIGAAITLFAPVLNAHGPLQWGLVAWLLLFSGLLYERLKGLPDLPVLYFLGNISFSLYLSHMIMIKLIRKYDLTLGLDGIAGLLWALATSLVLATVLYYAVEKTGIRVCRKLLQRLSAPKQRSSKHQMAGVAPATV